jgi:hypothetical protein
VGRRVVPRGQHEATTGWAPMCTQLGEHRQIFMPHGPFLLSLPVSPVRLPRGPHRAPQLPKHVATTRRQRGGLQLCHALKEPRRTAFNIFPFFSYELATILAHLKLCLWLWRRYDTPTASLLSLTQMPHFYFSLSHTPHSIGARMQCTVLMAPDHRPTSRHRLAGHQGSSTTVTFF